MGLACKMPVLHDLLSIIKLRNKSKIKHTSTLATTRAALRVINAQSIAAARHVDKYGYLAATHLALPLM